MKKLDVLISTCNNGIYSAIAVPIAPDPRVGYVIVHQQFGNFDARGMRAVYDALSTRPDVRLVESAEVGLSKSRNLALANSEADYVLLCDDDVELEQDFCDKILDGHTQLEGASIVAFKTRRIGGHQKRYPNTAGFLTYQKLFSVSSIEISLNLDNIKSRRIQFDERFGLGAPFPIGEENIFLSDAYRKDLRIAFCPAVIASHEGLSSGNDWNKINLRARGAVFRRVFGVGGIALLMVYFVKHRQDICRAGCCRGLLNCLAGFFRFPRPFGNA